MKDSLLERCNLQVENEAIVRSAARLDFEEIVKLGGLIFTSKGMEANDQTIRECRKLLNAKTGLFSNWRGTMKNAMLCKMALAEDPLEYFESTDAIYRKLVAGKLMHSEHHLMCATTIKDICPADQVDDLIEKTLRQYQLAKDTHPFLTSPSDLSFIALMVNTGADMEKLNQNAEECYERVNQLFKLYPDTKQRTSHILALSNKPVQEKVDYFWNLYLRLKETGHTVSRDKAIAILAAFVDLDVPVNDIAAEIAEVDEYLKKKKAYGSFLGVGNKFRRLMASVLVLQDYTDELGAAKANAMGTAVAQAIVEQIIQVIIYIIVSETVSASNAASNSNSN